jgi:acyl-CoA thioesterase
MDFEKRMEETNVGNHFMIHNFMKLTELLEDHAVVELQVRQESKNLFGGIHGGVYVTMADCAAGAAARSRGKRYVTLSNNFEFFRTTRLDHIRAIASVRHRGNTICVVSVDVKDGEDRLLAGGTFTMFATGKLED